jgi:hypothetical protein
MANFHEPSESTMGEELTDYIEATEINAMDEGARRSKLPLLLYSFPAPSVPVFHQPATR